MKKILFWVVLFLGLSMSTRAYELTTWDDQIIYNIVTKIEDKISPYGDLDQVVDVDMDGIHFNHRIGKLLVAWLEEKRSWYDKNTRVYVILTKILHLLDTPHCVFDVGEQGYICQRIDGAPLSAMVYKDIHQFAEDAVVHDWDPQDQRRRAWVQSWDHLWYFMDYDGRVFGEGYDKVDSQFHCNQAFVFKDSYWFLVDMQGEKVSDVYDAYNRFGRLTRKWNEWFGLDVCHEAISLGNWDDVYWDDALNTTILISWSIAYTADWYIGWYTEPEFFSWNFTR